MELSLWVSFRVWTYIFTNLCSLDSLAGFTYGFNYRVWTYIFTNLCPVWLILEVYSFSYFFFNG